MSEGMRNIPRLITAEWLANRGACLDGRQLFRTAFPNGAHLRDVRDVRTILRELPWTYVAWFVELTMGVDAYWDFKKQFTVMKPYNTGWGTVGLWPHYLERKYHSMAVAAWVWRRLARRLEPRPKTAKTSKPKNGARGFGTTAGRVTISNHAPAARRRSRAKRSVRT